MLISQISNNLWPNVCRSFFTDVGVAMQHLQYTRTELVECVPFGEDFGWSLSPVEGHQQNTAAYYTPYTFSGKERDMEMRSIREDLKKISTTEQTGLSYFGARYYDAGLSIWLSVDPMSDKYPSLSAYNYCAWNPVMLVDPDGREIETTEEGWKIISAALVATLGKNHPFSWNKETGKVEFDGKADLTGFKKDTQKEIIDKYKTLVEKKDFNVNVQVKGNDEEIQDQNGGITTLRQQEARGLTVLSADGKSANVYISEEPLYKQDGKWFVNPQKQDEQGITSLHEIGGHAYYFSQGIYNTGPNGKENNRLTSEFEGHARQVFKGKNLTNYIKKQPITYHR